MNPQPTDQRPPDPADWQQALVEWQRAKDEETRLAEKTQKSLASTNWWLDAFADRPTPSEARGHRCGAHEMLTLVAYDIRAPRRLVRVARYCEDFGMRVQYSVFECRLAGDAFDVFWDGLQELIDPDEDRIVAYKICAACAQNVHEAGTMERSEQVVAYVA